MLATENLFVAVRARALAALIPPRLELSTWIGENIRLPDAVSDHQSSEYQDPDFLGPICLAGFV
jgi:hypothetical protein